MGTRRDLDKQPSGLTHNPFAKLRPEGAQPAERKSEPEPDETKAPSARGGRLVVRREKRGRGGKTVTRVSGLQLDASALAELARDMKRALGCGASTDGADVLLQGALTERAAQWLQTRFGSQVTIGN